MVPRIGSTGLAEEAKLAARLVRFRLLPSEAQAQSFLDRFEAGPECFMKLGGAKRVDDRMGKKSLIPSINHRRGLQFAYILSEVERMKKAVELPAPASSRYTGSPLPGAPRSPLFQPKQAGERPTPLGYDVETSRLAPSVTLEEAVEKGRAWPIMFLIPIAAANGPAVLMPLRPGIATFGERRTPLVPLETQAERAAVLLSVGIATQFACHMRNACSDVVIVIPHDVPPSVILRSQQAMEAARLRGAVAAWCSIGAIADTPAYEPAVHAMTRIRDMGEPAPDSGLQIGIWQRARPVIKARAARAWQAASENPAAKAEWAAFMVAEKGRGRSLHAAFLAADNGNGRLAGYAEQIRTACDYAAVLDRPLQGLPSFADRNLLLHPYPERPPPLITAWLVRLPPQSVPPGCPVEADFAELVSGWGRRLVCETVNRMAEHDWEVLDKGSSTLRRHEFLCLGDGAAMRFGYADGIGSFSAWDVIWVRRPVAGAKGEREPKVGPQLPPTKMYVILDFEDEGNEHKKLDVIKRILGDDISDQELMSFLMQGTRFKIPSPREIRIRPYRTTSTL